MKRNVDINSILRPLSETVSQAYISNALQVADVLEWIIQQRSCLGGMCLHSRDIDQATAGGRQPLTVRQSTFSISEEFLRRMYFIKKKYPARFIVVIDRKALMKTVQLWRFIDRVYDEVYIADNHSKILLVSCGDADSHSTAAGVAMVTSQNLTRGNRAESSVISSDSGIYGRLLDDFNNIIKNHSAPMHELLPTSVNRMSSATDCQTVNHGQQQANNDCGANEISEIERLAGFFVPISDIAVILEMDPMALRDRIADPESPESIAYRRGKAMAKVKIRAQEMELAGCGSPLGLQSVRENLLTMESDED